VSTIAPEAALSRPQPDQNGRLYFLYAERTMKILLGTVMTVVLLISTSAYSQKQSPSETRDAEPAQASPDAAAAQARLGTLIVQASTDCELKINGDSMGILRAGQPQEMQLKPGQVFVECSASEDSWDGSSPVLRAGQQANVRLRLPPPGRFTERAEGTHDAELGVIWTASVNDGPIDWPGAKAYCASKGAGWRLPTVLQLQSLYAVGATPKPQIGKLCCLWSSEPRTAESTFFMMLHSGSKSSGAPSLNESMRALCVRRP